MKTKMPSDEVGSPSSSPTRLCSQKPQFWPPVAVGKRPSWVTTPRTKTCWPLPLPLAGANGERWVRPSAASPTEPCTSPMVRIGVTVMVSVQASVCGSASLLLAVISTG